MGGTMVDLTGTKVGKFTVLSYVQGSKVAALRKWVCVCECGAVKEIRGSLLRAGRPGPCHSCKTASDSSHQLYGTWKNMHQRCSNPNDSNYKHYGARGITVCAEWASFRTFVDDMGERPAGTTLDRIDNEKGYSHVNCRWATVTEQRNNTRNNKFLSYRGERLTLAQWARRLGISSQAMGRRVADGLCEAELFFPKRKRGGRK